VSPPDTAPGRTLRPGILVDRDGTLIAERHYLSDPAGVELLPGVAEAIAAVNRAGIPIALTSNQSGIGRGYFTEADLAAVNGRIAELLEASSAHLDGLYHCPHLPDAGCGCRKPAPGMAEEAATDLGLDLGRSFVIGDKRADVGLGRSVGGTAILVRTGYGRESEANGVVADHTFDDLATALGWILARRVDQEAT
jgi:histidinol-phosphate phosphatase family protein